jgi:hypothetical protein
MHYMLAMDIAELFLGFLIKPSKPHHSLVKEQPRSSSHQLSAATIPTKFPAKHG